MAPLLHQPSAVQHQYPAAEPAGGHAVGDENGRPVLRDMVQLLIDLIFRLRVQSGRGLIQDQYRSLSVQGPGYGDFLGL